MKINIGFVVSAIALVLWIGISQYRNKTEFPELFEEYGYIHCITTRKVSGSATSRRSVVYRYEVQDIVYKGIEAVKNIDAYKIPNGKYLIVYSKKDPSYHVFFGIEVKDNIKDIKVTKEELKKRFDVNGRAKKVK